MLEKVRCHTPTKRNIFKAHCFPHLSYGAVHIRMQIYRNKDKVILCSNNIQIHHNKHEVTLCSNSMMNCCNKSL